MKYKSFKILSAILVFVFIVALIPTNLSAQKPENSSEIDYEKVLETRFLNMLNHNFVYSEDFESLDDIVNNSAIALLNQKDGDHIDASVLNTYLYNMYGLEIEDFSTINEGFNFKEGYAYISPGGYAQYKHTAESLTENPDGTFTFLTNVSIKTHDAQSYTSACETVFVKNEKSVFGYNIVTSDIE